MRSATEGWRKRYYKAEKSGKPEELVCALQLRSFEVKYCVAFLVLSLTERNTERARSISPTKDSPMSTPTATDRARNSRITLSPPPDLQLTTEVSTRDKVLKADMDRSGSEPSPTNENSIPFAGSERTQAEKDIQRVNSIKGSPSNA